jgi:hypothetical protein
VSISTLFPPSVIAEQRSRANATMVDSATIYAPVEVTDEDSGITSTTFPTLTAVTRCRVAPMSPEERIVADRQAEAADAVVVMPVGTIVGHTYRITVSGVVNGEAWSEIYDVVGVDAPRSYETERRVRVRTLRTGTVA